MTDLFASYQLGNLELAKPFGTDEFSDLVTGRIRAAKSEPPTRIDIPILKRLERP